MASAGNSFTLPAWKLIYNAQKYGLIITIYNHIDSHRCANIDSNLLELATGSIVHNTLTFTSLQHGTLHCHHQLYNVSISMSIRQISFLRFVHFVKIWTSGQEICLPIENRFGNLFRVLYTRDSKLLYCVYCL